MMKKSLLALSVAAAAMGAQAADVQVYGLIDTSLSFVSSDADIAGHDRVNSFSMENAKEFGSRFGLKGSEDLGNGYKVAFVLESGIKSDDGSLDQGGKLFGREAHVDLVGPFGKLSAGLMPVFGSTLGADGLFRAIDPLFANYTKAFGSGHVTASSWTRVDNALSYVTPTVAGFTGYAMYSFKNDSSKGGVEGHGGESDRYASLAARYKARPRAGVGFDGINAVAGDYGFVDGYGVSLGVNVPAMGGVAKAQVAYRDMDNVAFKRVIAALGYDYALSKRTAVYAMTGWSQEKVENGTTEAKPNGYEFTTGIVHRF